MSDPLHFLEVPRQDPPKLTAEIRVRRWDEIEVDWDLGLFRNLTQDLTLPIEPLSRADRSMLEAGGLVGYLKRDIQTTGDAQ